MWTVSRILNLSPFSDEVQKLSSAQMNWILEMYAQENPDVKLSRPGEVSPVDRAVAWDSVLIEGVSAHTVSRAAVEAAKKLRAARGM